MSKENTYQAMSDKQLAFHHAVWLNLACLSIIAIPACFVAGIWFDWRWFPTTAVAVMVMAFSLLAGGITQGEKERRKVDD